jgi:hypothetical protein
MLSREDIQKIASINSILQRDEDECEIEVESINWLIQMVLYLDAINQDLQNEHERLSNAVDVLLDKLRSAQEG